MGKIKLKPQVPKDSSKPHKSGIVKQKHKLGKTNAVKTIPSFNGWIIEKANEIKLEKKKKQINSKALSPPAIKWRPVPPKRSIPDIFDSSSGGSGSDTEVDDFLAKIVKRKLKVKPSVNVAPKLTDGIKKGKQSRIGHVEKLESTTTKISKKVKSGRETEKNDNVDYQMATKSDVQPVVLKEAIKTKKHKKQRKIEKTLIENTEERSRGEKCQFPGNNGEEVEFAETKVKLAKPKAEFPHERANAIKKSLNRPKKRKNDNRSSISSMEEDIESGCSLNNSETQSARTRGKPTPYVNKVETSFSATEKWTPIDCKFSIVSDTSVLLTLTHPSRLYIHGVLKVSCISGKCEIMGHTLTQEPQIVYSLRGTSFLYFETIECSECVLKLERHYAPNVHFVNKYITQNIIPDLQKSTKMEKILQCRFADKHRGLVFQKSTDWDNLVLNLSYYQNKSKMVICGGKSVGKSTLVRFLVNKLLPASDVLCIDLDMGQSEFFVPGCISAVKVTKPLIGPNFTHMMKPERCFFIGSIDVGSSVDTYVNSAIQLFEYCRTTYPDIPWVINTMGFVQGLGEKLAALIIQLFQPTHVVQINSTNRKYNFYSMMDSFHVGRINERNPILSKSGLKNYRQKYEMFMFDSVAKRPESRDSNDWNVRPREMRYMNILSYLSGVLKNGAERLTDVQPYVRKLKSLQLKALGAQVIPELLPATVNGNMVALCYDNDSKPNKTTYPCIGFGIVRGISDDDLYLLTPLRANDLMNISSLILSAEPLPSNLYLLGNCTGQPIPYVSTTEKRHTTTIPRRVTFVFNKRKLLEQISQQAEATA